MPTTPEINLSTEISEQATEEELAADIKHTGFFNQKTKAIREASRRIVEACQSGVVAASDDPDDVAEAILTLLRSESLRTELGANARRCAVERYDWRVLSAGLADALLGS